MLAYMERQKNKKNNTKAFLKRAYHFLRSRYAPRGARISFSGSGEDIVMANILNRLGVKDIYYLDIGAHHPFFGNNTYLFYRNKGKGVLIEPNPDLCSVIKKKRPRDICVNAGVGKADGRAPFYVFSRSTRNTFSYDDALEWEKQSGEQMITREQNIFSLNTILDTYCLRTPDVVSIDAEGYDYEILSGFNWKKRPKIFCVESLDYYERNLENRDDNLYALLEKNDYRPLAQIFHNTIFVDSRLLSGVRKL